MSKQSGNRIYILEDVDADGRSDTATTFAKSFAPADGLALGNGGVYLTTGTNLLFLEDNDRDGKADKTTVIASAPGPSQGHCQLTDLAWGPEGYLYMNQRSQFEHPRATASNRRTAQIQATATVVRYHSRTKKMEVFADQILVRSHALRGNRETKVLQDRNQFLQFLASCFLVPSLLFLIHTFNNGFNRMSRREAI